MTLFQQAFSEHPHSIPLRVLNEFHPKTAFEKNYLKASGFDSTPGNYLCLPKEDGSLSAVIYCFKEDPWDLARLVELLPEGQYELLDETKKLNLKSTYLAWGLAHYRFEHFIPNRTKSVTLKKTSQALEIQHALEAISMIRDWVNLPAESLGPDEIQAIMSELAQIHHAQLKGIIGQDLLLQNFPAIHAVGRASPREPRLLHLIWGNPKHPVLCLVGKGVCFDTGGLDMKNSSGMALMKKDMGGAAHALGLGQWIMAEKLPIHLHIIIPAVDNVISGNSYRPGDVIPTRQGLFIEITDTDAEGRVILSDALSYAREQAPKLILDFATLTGAARVALGPDIPVVYASESSLLKELFQIAESQGDLLWSLPLHQAYREYFKSEIADMANSSVNSYAGSITAALFLESFTKGSAPWIHVDLMAWNVSSRPGRPKGGEAQGLRAFFYWIKSYFEISRSDD